MIPLLPATREAFDQRQLRIHPVLTVIDELGERTIIPPALIISRPARSQSPVISRSPVMRLDIELVPTDDVLALFKEQRRVRYAEVVNGQTFERFGGRVWALEKGWAVKAGAVVTSLKVTAYSESQRLAALDGVIHHAPKVLTAGVGKGIAFMPVVTAQRVYLTRGSSGNDPFPINAVWRPHTGETAATATYINESGQQQTRTAGTHFRLQMSESGPLEVNWLSSPPPPGTAYQVTARVPIAWVARQPFTLFDDFATPPSMEAYELTDDEPAVEAIAERDLDYCRYFVPGASLPEVHIRTGGGTGPATKQVASDWEFSLERGSMRYVGSRGIIFDQDDVFGGEACFVGIKGLAWPDVTHRANSPEALVAGLYEQAGAIESAEAYQGFEATGITVAEFDASDKGDKLLQTVVSAVPPNYILFDEESGCPRGRYLLQSPRPQLHLNSVKGLKDKEPPEFYTRVVVRSPIPDQPPHDGTLLSGITASNPYGALTEGDDTYASPAPGWGFIRVAYPLTDRERFKSLKVRFEGEFRAMVAPLVSGGGAPDMSRARYVPGFQVAYQAGPSDLTMGNLRGLITPDDPVGTYLVIEVHPAGTVSSPKLYRYELTVDRVLTAIALLHDQGTSGAWVETADGWEYVVESDLLKRWLVNEHRAADLDTYRREWWKHRTKTIEVGAVSRQRAKVIARAHLEDVLRRATAQEIDVVLEPHLQLGDTVAIYDPGSRTTFKRLVVGFRENASWEEPAATLEVADYS